jgi:hypothetical protein
VMQAHQHDQPKPSFNVKSISEENVETLLVDLVKVDQVGGVQEIICAFPNALGHTDTRHKLHMLASFASSGAMLEVLDLSSTDLYGQHIAKLIAQSPMGRNESTLKHLLFRSYPGLDSMRSDRVRKDGVRTGTLTVMDEQALISQLIRSDWCKGMKIWTKWIESIVKYSTESSIERARYLYASKRVLLAAASHSTGVQQLFSLWRDSGLTSSFDRDLADKTLRNVAGLTCSITLATYLLQQGARVNARTSRIQKTSLQRAAENNSPKGAEMIRFLLLNGADPEADQVRRGEYPGKMIRDEDGAKGIHQWLGKTWDELVEETKPIRNGNRVGISTLTEGSQH